MAACRLLLTPPTVFHGSEGVTQAPRRAGEACHKESWWNPDWQNQIVTNSKSFLQFLSDLSNSPTTSKFIYLPRICVLTPDIDVSLKQTRF